MKNSEQLRKKENEDKLTWECALCGKILATGMKSCSKPELVAHVKTKHGILEVSDKGFKELIA